MTASSLAAGGGLVAAIGRERCALPAAESAEFASFEGFVVHACLSARRDGVLRDHPSLAFLTAGLDDLQTLAGARLDDAIISRLEQQSSEVPAGSAQIHRFPQRSGADR